VQRRAGSRGNGGRLENFKQNASAARREAPVPPPSSVDQDEGHLEIDAIFGNLAVLSDDLLLLDPRALDVLERLDRASDALLDGIFEARIRAGDNLRDSGYRHLRLPCE